MDVLGANQNMSKPDALVIDVVDNGGQWTHREWRMLRYLKVDTKIIPNDTPIEDMRELDGLILSGGAARVGLTGELGYSYSWDMCWTSIHGPFLWRRCERISRA